MAPRKSSTTTPKAKPEPAAPTFDDSKPIAEEEIPLPTNASPKTKAQADAELRDFLDGRAGGEGLRGDDSRVRGLRDDIRLKQHQVKGRLWMKEREDPAQKKFGGILADDMGVGKTLQTIACILDRRRTKDQAASGWSKATLVICPLAVVPHWETEITSKTTDLKAIVYHGSRREALAPKLPNADVVITTYSTLQAEHSRGKDTLTKVKWLRVVLDEAHTIKNRATKTAAACFDLKALFRWCLTATPMQNTVEDFYSLFHFLHIKPLNDWTRFNQLIAKPIDKGHGDAGLAMKRLQVVLTHVLLRRMKSQLECLKLPNKTVKLISCPFDAQELAFYRALKAVSNAILKRLLKNKEMDGSKKYMNILVLLLRLRQACDHPRLALKDYEEALDELEQEEGPHVIPKTFLDVDSDTEDEADGRRKPRRCQGCSARLTRTSMAGKDWPEFCINCAALQVQTENLSGPLRPSAKVKRIVRILKGVTWGEKTVIFSQWTSFFDLLEPFLMGMGVKYTRYDGSMTMDERAAALHEISNDPRITVILVSLKAGGQGLNLTACNHVILADMWWNPAVEEQAFDRTHRVGQTRDVHVYKLRVEETVEDRILELQERKRELARTALSASSVKGVKLSLEELVNLFK